jgi:transcriptional regulator with XRE-family HTH domain
MTETKTSPMSEWLRRTGDIEFETDITVGTRGPKANLPRVGRGGSLAIIALGKLIELKRREAGLSIDDLASSARVTVSDIVQLERGFADGVNPIVLLSLAGVLKLPPQQLAKLLIPNVPETRPIQEAAVRFAAQTSETEALKPTERTALTEFVAVLEQAG